MSTSSLTEKAQRNKSEAFNYAVALQSISLGDPGDKIRIAIQGASAGVVHYNMEAYGEGKKPPNEASM